MASHRLRWRMTVHHISFAEVQTGRRTRPGGGPSAAEAGRGFGNRDVPRGLPSEMPPRFGLPGLPDIRTETASVDLCDRSFVAPARKRDFAGFAPPTPRRAGRRSRHPSAALPLAKTQDIVARLEAPLATTSLLRVEGLCARRAYREAAESPAHIQSWVHPCHLVLLDAGLTGSCIAAGFAGGLAIELPTRIAHSSVPNVAPPGAMSAHTVAVTLRASHRAAYLRRRGRAGDCRSAGVAGRHRCRSGRGPAGRRPSNGDRFELTWRRLCSRPYMRAISSSPTIASRKGPAVRKTLRSVRPR